MIEWTYPIVTRSQVSHNKTMFCNIFGAHIQSKQLVSHLASQSASQKRWSGRGIEGGYNLNTLI